MKSHKHSNVVTQTAVTHKDSETAVTHKDLEEKADYYPRKRENCFTADERQPWTNYENNGNEYFTIGAVVRSE